MYETLYRLWRKGKLTEQALDNAVAKGWITEKQKITIIE